MKIPFKKPNDSGDTPYYIDESIIKEYEKSVEIEKELENGAKNSVRYAKKIKELRDNPTEIQQDIDDLRIFQNETYLQMVQGDLASTVMHIQSLKAIAALEQIMRFTIKKLPREQSDELLSKIQGVVNQTITTDDKDVLNWLRNYMKHAKDDTNL